MTGENMISIKRALSAVILVAALASAAGPSAGAIDASSPPALKIYLPREALVQGERIELGALGILRGDEALARRAASVAVGRFSVAGQQIVIDRATILAMLASAGIDAHTAAISGADSVTVRRNEDVVPPERFIAVAQAFMEEHLKGHAPGDITVITRPKPYVITKPAGDVRLAPRAHPYSTPSRPRAWVDVVVDGKVRDEREIAFSIRYTHQRIVATADIAEGEVITTRNVGVETVETSLAPPPDMPAPYGLVARRAMRKGAVIRETMVGPELPPVVIKRRQVVLVKFETPLLLVSSFGEAMEDGKAGDLIRVKVNSGKDAKMIVTRIGADGTVSPAI